MYYKYTKSKSLEKFSKVKNDPALSTTGRIYFAHGNTDISSKEIRTGQRSRMERLRENVSFSKGNDAGSYTYFIRDDLDWALEPWRLGAV